MRDLFTQNTSANEEGESQRSFLRKLPRRVKNLEKKDKNNCSINIKALCQGNSVKLHDNAETLKSLFSKIEMSPGPKYVKD